VCQCTLQKRDPLELEFVARLSSRRVTAGAQRHHPGVAPSRVPLTPGGEFSCGELELQLLALL
jgi:hypothetical protein